MAQQFQSMLAEKGISLSNEQVEQFDTYYRLLIEWNNKMNLTAITERNEVYLKHFYDSLTLGFVADLSQSASLCDVGAGAGFPSLPLKICFPHIEVTIIDSLNKRIGFLEHLRSQLGLEHVHLYHGRAEEFGKNKAFRESFDFVTARAVAKLSVLSEYCLPITKREGSFFAMKGTAADEEIQQSEHAIHLLGGKIGKVHSLTLPGEESERNIIHIHKVSHTPKAYPRKAGTPNKKPLS